MKLKIKYNDKRKKIDISQDETSGELISKAKDIHGVIGCFAISLNGKDIIRTPATQPVKDLGLVSGDLIHLIEQNDENLLESLINYLEDHKDCLKECSMAADYMFILSHMIMLSLGFHVKDDISNNEDAKKDGNVNWKTSTGFYKFNYLYKTYEVLIECTGSVLGNGKFLALNGVLIWDEKMEIDVDENNSGDSADDNSEPCSVQLKLSEYIQSTALQTKNPKEIFKNVKQLQQKILDHFASKLIDDIDKKFNKRTTITSLSSSILVLIFKYLDIEEMPRVALVSKYFRQVCNSAMLWKHYLFRELEIKSNDSTGYKEAVKSLYKQRKEEERSRQEQIKQERERVICQQQSIISRPRIDTSYPGGIPFRDISGPMPGIIGGHYDLYPQGNPAPGPFGIPSGVGGTPDIIPGRPSRKPMGARYDPIGSHFDDEVGRGRIGHPDMMRRPGFGSFFDAGGFI